ncbi:MAG TPA: hypothetical protein VJC11_03110, partial [Patescibacteria group bacterium]|nr:hypothetical protein [Patescibacteria group bacterium]
EVTKPEAVPVAPAVGTETPFSTFDAHQTEIAHSVNLPPQHGTDAEIAGIREANHLTEMEKKYGFESVNPPQAPKEGAVAAASEIVGAPLAVEAVASGAQKVVENSELGIKGVFQHAPDGKVSGISIEGEVGFAKANYLIDELGHHHQLNEHGMHNPAGFRQEADATIEIYKQQQLLKTLQEVGRGDSAEAAFLRNEIQHSVQSTEEKFGHIFKEEYVKDFKTVGHETQQSSAEQETIPGVHAAESTIKLQSDGISGNIHFKYDANGNPEELFYDQQGLLLTKATGREFVDSSKTFDLARQHYLSEHTFRDQLSRDGLNLITKNTRIYEELRHAGSHKEADFVRRIIEHNAEEMEQKFGTGVINQEKLSEALKK